ncbi:Blastula protease 10 [Oopsacas minuta]|uniref:Metalloendopeptidase n=1 Tax=Oopsacas minuta TaxID=111878 RepID=A0AAV7JX97_9METZ|nr:Blastula protease 10 [Oopsacas minuta]
MRLYLLLVFLFISAVVSLQTDFILPQRRRYFGNGELKIPQNFEQTDKYQNITLWFILNLTRREYRELKRALNSLNITHDIPKDDLVARQRDIEGGLFEGDIKFNEPLLDKVWHLKPRRRLSERAITRWEISKWPNAIVPYLIDSSVGLRTKDRIYRAMNHISSKTCVTFVERNDEENYVLFESRNYMCASNVGMQGRGEQIISVRFCDNRGMIIHEICHALGFWHEQSRPDRSQYVRILWENIVPEKRVNFARHTQTSINSLGVSYDLGSIMHYGLKAFSVNGKPTMEVLTNFSGKVGQRSGLSVKDREQLNILYNCPSHYLATSPPTMPATTTTTTPPIYIQTNTPIALKSADTNQWPLCYGPKCFANGCPGKIFKEKNINKCPSNIFALELVGTFAGTDPSNIRNGNLVVLKRKYRGRESETGVKWIYCERTHCFVTDYCDRNGQFDMSHCHQQVMKITVEGKSVGESIESNDVIRLQYHDPTATNDNIEIFSCFDNKGPTDRCSKQTPCDVNNEPQTCQQTRFHIIKIPIDT